jgi:hypothetical protein
MVLAMGTVAAERKPCVSVLFRVGLDEVRYEEALSVGMEPRTEEVL